MAQSLPHSTCSMNCELFSAVPNLIGISLAMSAISFLAALIRDSALEDVVERIVVCRDPKDDHVLELAVNGQATCVVSGDNDLLTLHPFRDIPILKPAEFLL